MSADTNTRLDAIIEREDRERREDLQRALDRGGMPTDAEFVKAEAMLRAAYDQLEALGWRVSGIAGILDDPDLELPFPVTSEHVGLVAGYGHLLDTDLRELGQVLARLKQAVYDLELIRQAQRSRDDA